MGVHQIIQVNLVLKPMVNWGPPILWKPHFRGKQHTHTLVYIDKHQILGHPIFRQIHFRVSVIVWVSIPQANWWWDRHPIRPDFMGTSKTIVVVVFPRLFYQYRTVGGGGSFKNRKPIGELGCCESRMAERIHWWTRRWLELCFLKWLQWSPHHNCWM